MPRRKPESNIVNLAELLRSAGEELTQQATRPDVTGYVPHDKQKVFHGNDNYGRLFIGGNRSGKTVGGVVEDIWWLTGTHPLLKTPKPPVRGRAVAVDIPRGVNLILIPEFKRWLPKKYLKNGSWDDSFSKSDNLLTLTNGSTIEFMSYEQDTDKFAGTSRHFIHFDEEPPQHIFNENMMRLLDTNGRYWITMTPVEGMTWMYDEIYLPATSGQRKDIHVLEVHSKENPHLNEEARERVLGGIQDKDERRAREEGKFIEIGGRVFKSFSENTHVIPGMIPDHRWEWYMSIDSGWNNPTAILWHAVSPDNVVITFSEHYQSEMTVEDHAKIIHKREAQKGWKPADIRTGDPAMRQTRESTGTSVQQEYALRGVYLALDGVPTGPGSVHTGVMRMQQYLKLNEKNGKPRWFITEDCPNLIREMKRLHWQMYASKKTTATNNPQEKIHKKDDHAADSARYFFTLMPDLTPEIDPDQIIEVARSGGQLRYDEALTALVKTSQERPDAVQFVTDIPSGTSWEIVETVDSYT
jgi:phage terminase large subunit-like protein